MLRAEDNNTFLKRGLMFASVLASVQFRDCNVWAVQAMESWAAGVEGALDLVKFWSSFSAPTSL